mgnify:CR=1 FL=1
MQATVISLRLQREVAVIELILDETISVEAKIIDNLFPPGLIDLINDSIEAANELSIALFDDLQNEINSYDFILKDLDIPIYNLYIKDDVIKLNLKSLPK